MVDDLSLDRVIIGLAIVAVLVAVFGGARDMVCARLHGPLAAACTAPQDRP